MANSCAAFLYPSAIWQALLVFISVTAVRATDAGGQGQCPPFSCGDLHNISYPFRRPGDPPECGVKAYELVCIHGKNPQFASTRGHILSPASTILIRPSGLWTPTWICTAAALFLAGISFLTLMRDRTGQVVCISILI